MNARETTTTELRESEELTLGKKYLYGIDHCEQNDAKAENLLLQAAKNEAEAHFYLGKCYARNVETEQKAIKHYQEAANQGYVPAQSELGYRLLKGGNGINQNIETAILMLTQAAEKGDARAQNILGTCFDTGTGVPQNKNGAFEWFRKSAEQGHANGQLNVGACLFNGIGIEKDQTAAMKWFRKSAEQGNNVAQLYLGNFLYHGTGVEKDEKAAVEYYQKSAAQGNAEAQYYLGSCLANGIGIEKNYEAAIEWFRKSAVQGNAKAKEIYTKLKLAKAGLVPCYPEAKNPCTIYIPGKGPVPIAKIEEEDGFVWTESQVTTEYLKKQLAPRPTFDLKGLHPCASQVLAPEFRLGINNAKQIEHYLAHPQDYLDQFALTERGIFGRRVVARQDIEISNKILFLYSGKLVKSTKYFSYSWNMPLLIRHRIASEPIVEPGNVDAKNFGNVVRYLPHAPLFEELKEAKIPGINPKTILVCNTVNFKSNYKDIQNTCFAVCYNIGKGKQIATWYSPGYWQDCAFFLFDIETGLPVAAVQYDKDGNLIPEQRDFQLGLKDKNGNLIPELLRKDGVHPAALFYLPPNANLTKMKDADIHPAFYRP